MQAGPLVVMCQQKSGRNSCEPGDFLKSSGKPVSHPVAAILDSELGQKGARRDQGVGLPGSSHE